MLVYVRGKKFNILAYTDDIGAYEACSTKNTSWERIRINGDKILAMEMKAGNIGKRKVQMKFG